jgi:hypothetical protein
MLHVEFFFWILLLSLVVAIYRYNRLRNYSMSVLPWVLAVTVMTELIGGYIKFGTNNNNGWLYSIFALIQFPCYIELFRQQFKASGYRRVALISFCCFIIWGLINFFFVQGYKTFDNYTVLVGSFILILLACLFFYELILKTDGEVSLLSVPMFWIGNGLFIFSTGTFFYISVFNYLNNKRVDWVEDIFNLIMPNLNVVLYSCIIIGILLLKPASHKIGVA